MLRFTSPSTARHIVTTIRKNTLVTNALNLMLSAGVTALFGFVFWVVIARNFASSEVGLATALLSMSALLSLLGLAGFDTVFVRFLPKSVHRNQHINSGLVIGSLMTLVSSAAFCALVPILSPKLAFVAHSPETIALFIGVTLLTTWNTLTNSVFIAYRKTSFIVVINIIFSVVKMLMPFVIHSGSPLTIFAFVGIAQLTNVSLSIAALIRYFDYRPSLRLDLAVLHEVKHYGAATYFANILNVLPDTALPLIIVNRLGASAAAYFYIAFTIANLLYTIAFATTQAVLAEASHNENELWQHIKHGLFINACLLLPAILLLVIICPFILSIFNNDYQDATSLLRILSISGLVVLAYSTLGGIFKITRSLRAIIIMNATNALSIIILSLLLVPVWGLGGVGWAWLFGNIASAVIGFLLLRAQLSPHKHARSFLRPPSI